MPSGPKKRRAAKKKKASLEIGSQSAKNLQDNEIPVKAVKVPGNVVEEPKDLERVVRIVDYNYDAEGSEQENLGNLDNGLVATDQKKLVEVAVDEVVVKESENREGVQYIVDSNYNAEESKQENRGNLNNEYVQLVSADLEIPVEVVVKGPGNIAVSALVVEEPEDLERTLPIVDFDYDAVRSKQENLGNLDNDDKKLVEVAVEKSEKTAVDEVVVKESEDREGVQYIVDSNYNAEESKQENRGNFNNECVPLVAAADHEKPVEVVIKGPGNTAVSDLDVEDPEYSEGVQSIVDSNYNVEGNKQENLLNLDNVNALLVGVVDQEKPVELVVEESGNTDVDEVGFEDQEKEQTIVDFNSKESLENLNTCNLDDDQVDVSLGSSISTEPQTTPVEPEIDEEKNAGSYSSEPLLIDRILKCCELEQEHSTSSDHKKTNDLSSEVLASPPINDESHSHLLKTNVVHPTKDTHLNDLTTGEAAESLTAITISRDELNKIIGLNNRLKESLNSAVGLGDELNQILNKILKPLL